MAPPKCKARDRELTNAIADGYGSYMNRERYMKKIVLGLLLGGVANAAMALTPAIPPDAIGTLEKVSVGSNGNYLVDTVFHNPSDGDLCLIKTGDQIANYFTIHSELFRFHGAAHSGTESIHLLKVPANADIKLRFEINDAFLSSMIKSEPREESNGSMVRLSEITKEDLDFKPNQIFDSEFYVVVNGGYECSAFKDSKMPGFMEKTFANTEAFSQNLVDGSNAKFYQIEIRSPMKIILEPEFKILEY